ncbi:acyltransferase family protein [Aminirod propionatiphilus]|uniref:Acyltransferase family protein n=1 Tax=Aminirod propionatiphilus TaxID=3415223 RepID=A0ACD1DTH2_9BACT|nr:acyltransferase family protein [Synergistota bacterium]
MQEKRAARIAFFDAYRTFLVFAVVSLHAAMVYMAHVPAWWYVIDPERSLFFLAWVLVTDTFPMPALFFVSGYFAPLSLERRGRSAFLKDKLLRIGLPWGVGVLLFAPLFARATWKSLGLPLPSSHWAFVRTLWIGPAYQQAHFWFLGVLLAFFLLFAFAASLRRPSASRLSPLRGMLLWWGLASATFFLSSLRWHHDLWISLGPLYFQPARIVSYLAAFCLGGRAWRDGWFDGPGVGRKVLPLAALGAFLGALVVVILPFRFAQSDALGAKALRAMAYAFASLSMGSFFLLVCSAFLNRPSPRWRLLGESSYGVYWLHQMILMPLAALLVPLSFPGAVKFVVALVGTCGLCFLLTVEGLRRLPFLRRIF